MKHSSSLHAHQIRGLFQRHKLELSKVVSAVASKQEVCVLQNHLCHAHFNQLSIYFKELDVQVIFKVNRLQVQLH